MGCAARSTRTRASFAPHEAIVYALKISLRNYLESEALVQCDVPVDVCFQIGVRSLLIDHLEKPAQQGLADSAALKLRVDTDRSHVPVASMRVLFAPQAQQP